MSLPSTYSEAQAARAGLYAEVERAGAVLAAFPKTGPFNLTPDDVKSSPEFQSAKRAFDAAFGRLRAFNTTFTKTFAKEIRAERRARSVPSTPAGVSHA